MPLFIDQKFANLVSSKLPLFKWQGQKVAANFRCPLCGDSQKQKTKKRGYFYAHKDTLMMKCHNCAASMPFGAFLKQVDHLLHKEYIRDSFQFDNDHRWYDKKSNEREERVVEVQEVDKKQTTALSLLTSVMDLEDDHPCKIYVRNRKIPMKFWRDLYYSDNYQKWIHKHVDNTVCEKYPVSDPRLVIPFNSSRSIPFAYQGRHIGKPNKSILRYITINPKESILIYGIDKVDNSKLKYAFEGPIDSMYIPNSIAVAGSALGKLLDTNKKKNIVFVFDNEPRNKDITKLMEKVIANGSPIVIWPKSVTEKDVGEMIEGGRTSEEILDIIQNCMYNGLEAKLQFNAWKVI